MQSGLKQVGTTAEGGSDSWIPMMGSDDKQLPELACGASSGLLRRTWKQEPVHSTSAIQRHAVESAVIRALKGRVKFGPLDSKSVLSSAHHHPAR